MTRSRFIILFLVFIMGTANAQNKTWNFRQCLDTAMQRNISVNQGKLTNEVNKITLEQSKANRIPSLSANMGEALNFGKTVNPTTYEYVSQAYHSTSMGVSASYNLFNGMQNSNTIKQNILNVKSGEYDIEKVKNDVTLSVTTAYLQVLFAYEILATAKSQEQATIAQVERTEKLVKAGKSPESDLMQIKSQLATDNLSVINAQVTLDIAKVTLEQLMEIPITDDFEIAVPVLAEPAAIPQSNVDVYNKSLQVMPQISSAALKTSAAQMALKVAEGGRWPRLTLGGNMSSNYASSRKQGSSVNPEGVPFFTQLWDNFGQSLNLGLSIPIYSNRQIKSNIEKARINEMNSKLTEQNTKNILRKSVEQAFTDLRASGKKYEATKQQLAAVEAVYKNAEQKFNVGVMNATDFLIQKNSYISSQSSLIQTKYDFIFKGKILDFYQGKDIMIE